VSRVPPTQEYWRQGSGRWRGVKVDLFLSDLGLNLFCLFSEEEMRTSGGQAPPPTIPPLYSNAGKVWAGPPSRPGHLQTPGDDRLERAAADQENCLLVGGLPVGGLSVGGLLVGGLLVPADQRPPASAC